MKRKRGLQALLVSAIGAAGFAASAQAAPNYALADRIAIPDGGFDYVTIDSAARRLYLSHGTQVDVINPDNGTFTYIGDMNTGRWGHTATLLANGDVMVAGGNTGGTVFTDKAEVYDGSAKNWK